VTAGNSSALRISSGKYQVNTPRVLLFSQEVHPIPPLKGAAVEQWIDTVAHGLSGYVPYIVSVPHPQLPDSQIVGNVHYHRIRIGRLYNRLFRKLTRLDPYSYVDRIVEYVRERVREKRERRDVEVVREEEADPLERRTS